MDTVHQEDQDGIKGVYHINAVDEVTQWETLGAAAQISEAWLIPVLEAMLTQFPFRIRGFHSDNGLVESKNGAVVRKHMGYTLSRRRTRRRRRFSTSDTRTLT